jgi:hypothetical protein
MRASEFATELNQHGDDTSTDYGEESSDPGSDYIEYKAKLPDSMYFRLQELGYTILGGGVDQVAFLEPKTGLILKIFVSNDSTGPSRYSFAQQTVIAFINYCHKNPHNEFLPDFSAWERFEWEGRYYLQIRMERLFKITNYELGHALASMASNVKNSGSFEYWVEDELYIRDRDEEADIFDGDELLVGNIGMEGLKELWDTISQLYKIAKTGGFKLDLHDGNFMLGSDGHIVISDPFFSGWGDRNT